jgi:hypothetical protein
MGICRSQLKILWFLRTMEILSTLTSMTLVSSNDCSSFRRFFFRIHPENEEKLPNHISSQEIQNANNKKPVESVGILSLVRYLTITYF